MTKLSCKLRDGSLFTMGSGTMGSLRVYTEGLQAVRPAVSEIIIIFMMR